MATTIMMQNPQTGIVKKGFYGFSWTTLFFGGFPAIFRGDLVEGVLVLVANFLSFGLVSFVWAFIYNKRYTLKLVQQGYQFSGDEASIAMARSRLGIIDPRNMKTTIQANENVQSITKSNENTPSIAQKSELKEEMKNKTMDRGPGETNN